MEKIMVKFEANAAEVARLTCQLFDNACELVREVPSYTLRTNLTGRFWEAMVKSLNANCEISQNITGREMLPLYEIDAAGS